MFHVKHNVNQQKRKGFCPTRPGLPHKLTGSIRVGDGPRYKRCVWCGYTSKKTTGAKMESAKESDEALAGSPEE